MIILFLIMSLSSSLHSMQSLTKKSNVTESVTAMAPKAHLALGEYYLWGDDQHGPDYPIARQHFEKAAKQHEDLEARARAAFHLGTLYYFKQVVATDHQKMLCYLAIACFHASQFPELEEIILAAEILREPQPYNIQQIDKEGQSPLHRAAKKGYLLMARLLFKLGADTIIEKRVLGKTALCLAATYGHWALIEFLLARGADINAKDEAGWTPLRAATVHYQVATVRLLLQKGADQRKEDNRGHTPFYNVAKRGLCDLATLFLDNGAFIDEVDDYGWTALHWVAREGLTDMAQLLLARGARMDVVTLASSDTPLHIAYLYHQKEVAKILKAQGAKRDLRNGRGKIPKECSILDTITISQECEKEFDEKHGEELSASL